MAGSAVSSSAFGGFGGGSTVFSPGFVFRSTEYGRGRFLAFLVSKLPAASEGEALPSGRGCCQKAEAGLQIAGPAALQR